MSHATGPRATEAQQGPNSSNLTLIVAPLAQRATWREGAGQRRQGAYAEDERWHRTFADSSDSQRG
eukprot:8187551-Karenia_brevis.AAC.1